MSFHEITLARTGETQTIEASDWKQAIEKTGRDDACLVEYGRVIIDWPPVYTAFRCGVGGVTGVSAPSRESALQRVLIAIKHEVPS